MPTLAEKCQDHGRSISDDDLCASCINLYFCPGENSACKYLFQQGEWPCDRTEGGVDASDYVNDCEEFQSITDLGDNEVN